MRFFLSFLVLIAFAGMNSCTAFKKNISKQVTIALPDTLFNGSVTSSAQYTKYTATLTPRQAASAFLKGFAMEGKNTPNVKLQYTLEGADFILRINYLKIEETNKTQTISDPKSPYNGQQVMLNDVKVSAEFSIVEAKNTSKNLSACSDSKERSEWESSNRSIDDLVNGTNKDHTKYHTRLLSDNIASSLSEDVGRRIWVPITRRVANNLNE